MRGADRARLMARRVQDELRYKYATHYEIYRTRGGLRVMYYMIHATDHPDAPGLMNRAYRRAVLPKEPPEQVLMEFGQTP